jgi:transposase
MACRKKNAGRLGAHILFLDESGFLLTPTVRKTWSPVGQTPRLRHRQRHERVSAISAISASPVRQHFSLYCHLYEDNVQGGEVEYFLRHLLRQIPGHLFVLLDNASIHKSDPVGELRARTRRLHLVPLPAYAPELNPDEGIWNHLKRTLANGRPDSQRELMDVLCEEVCRLAGRKDLLRACIAQSELPFF